MKNQEVSLRVCKPQEGLRDLPGLTEIFEPFLVWQPLYWLPDKTEILFICFFAAINFLDKK